MLTDYSEYIKVIISDDSMEARLYLSSSPDSNGISHIEDFTYENLCQVLSENGVKAGVDNTLLKAICIEKRFDRFFIIARGSTATNGQDGYYTYKFKTEIDNKPKISPDGTVDYHDIDIYEPVFQGDEIATYTPASSGHYGYTVRGSVLTSVPGKELNPLKGKGFTVSEDKLHYYADCNGKVELVKDELIVSNLLDIKGDVDITTGDIIFNGDVIVHGSVLAGSLIRAAGSVVIMGNVEGAYITAGGDIELKAGMQGCGKGVIECGGDVWGKFFEQATIRVKNDLHANSMMNCTVYCEGSIFVSGRHGMIVGGRTACKGNLEATVLGNLAQVPTVIVCGLDDDCMQELSVLENQIKELEGSIRKHTQVLEKLNGITNPTDRAAYDQMLNQVNASLAELNNRLTLEQNKLNLKLELISGYSQSRITVQKYMYPRVQITLNGLHWTNPDTFTNVVVSARDGQVEVINQI